MKTNVKAKRSMILLAAVATSLSLIGCHKMKVQTTLNADGSGVRDMELTIEVDEGDTTMTLSDYRQLMNVTRERGWSHETSRKKSEKSGQIKILHKFTTEERASNIFELAEMSGDIHIIGTNHNPRFDGVCFDNSIYVETGMSPRGRILLYRETFSWTGMVEALLEYRLEQYRPPLKQHYPRFEAGEVDEWFGFFKGSFMAAVDDGVFDLDRDERARRFGESINRVAAYAMDMIHRENPKANDSLVVQAAKSMFVDWDKFDDTAGDMDLMGVVLATVLDLTVRVDVPGIIVETNADRREVYSDPLAGRQVMVWDIDPNRAATKPIEIFVKCEIPDR